MLLNEDPIVVRDRARRFAAESLAPRSAHWDEAHDVPRDVIDKLGALGLMGMLVPQEWDGAMSDRIAYGAALEEIAAGNGAISTIMSVHNSVRYVPILRFGNDAQFLRSMARGEALGAFCLTEPQAGSDASALRTEPSGQRPAGNWMQAPMLAHDQILAGASVIAVAGAVESMSNAAESVAWQPFVSAGAKQLPLEPN